MSDQILVIEYEPRYTERIREALAGEPVSLLFARDGDEALRLVEAEAPRLVILSSVIPRYGTADLVRQIRSRPGNQSLPILLTMSGYAGGNTRSDATRFGATDIIPKPFGPAELQSRVRELMGGPEAPSAPEAAPEAPAEPAATVRISTKDLLGDLTPEPERPHRKPSVEDELDRMLADTLSGVRVPSVKKKTPEPDRASEAKRKDSTDELDRLLQDTLSGLEKRRSRPAETGTPAPAPKVESREPAAPPEMPAPGPKVESREPAAPPEMPAPEPKIETPEPVAPPETPAPEPKVETPEPVAPPVPSAPPPVEPVAAPPQPPDADRVSPTVLARTPDQEEEISPKKAPEPPAQETDQEGLHFGQYVLMERIATGGMAEVWKARMRGVEGFEKLVAIKKILPHLSDNQEFVEMFVDEAKLAAQLNHNNIIHIYDLGKIADSYYIAMEFVDGHDLKSILKRADEMGDPVPTELALSVASKLAAALDYAHRKRGFEDQDLGIVHRDVSPQNVLIAYEGDIKLCDFGIAKAATKASHTQAGALKGKLLYMSPEQAWGRAIDRRSDIFSLATVLFEMLTGQKLFAGESELSILDQVREARVKAPSTLNDELSKEIDDLVLKGLAKEPENRYQTAGEMARAIDSVLFNYRPTPTAADLAIYMHRLYRMGEEPGLAAESAPALPVEEAPPAEEDIYSQPTIQAPLAEMELTVPPPEVEEQPAAPVEQPPTMQMPMAEAMAEPGLAPPTLTEPEARSKKSRTPMLIAAVVVAVAVAGFGGWYLTKGTGSPPPSTVPVAARPAPVAKPLPPQPAVTTTAITPEAAATENQPVLGKDDLKLIDQEVKKRIAEERKRLDQQAKPAPAATPAARVSEQRTKAPAEKPVESKPAAAQPAPAAPAEPQAAPTNENPPPTETSSAQAAPPPAPKPAAPKVKEGDLVQPGSPGLVEPSLISIKKVPYPPLARQEQIQGTVFVRALVSETGKVLQAKMLRGVRENVGINEAALEMVKGAKFKPATKDGVRVKAYVTIPIPFRL